MVPNQGSLTRRKFVGRSLVAASALAAGPALAWRSRAVGSDGMAHSGRHVYPLAMCSNGSILANRHYVTCMLAAGAPLCRIDMSFGMVRPTPEPNPDKWNWQGMEQVRAIRKKYPHLKFSPILGYCPSWAADPAYARWPGGPNSGLQRGVHVRPVNAAGNLFGQFVYETVRRYGDVVDCWESWNEPDLGGHYFFKGDGADFMPYQRAFYLAAKMADPKCTALFAGLSYRTVEGYLAVHHLKPPTPYPAKSCFFEQYLQAVVKDPRAARHNHYFDVMNQHSYSRATDLYDYAMVDLKLIHHYLRQSKPIWFTETGFPDTGGIFGGTPDQYCDYVLQSWAWAALAGVQKLFHFQLDNSNGLGLYAGGPANGGLGNPKPALTTWTDVLVAEFANATLVKQLHGHAGVGLLHGNSPYSSTWRTGYNLFEFQNTAARKRVFMAFADSRRAVLIAIPAKAKFATLVDRHNHRSRINATGGFYHLNLAGATNEAGWPADKTNPAAVALGKPEHLVGGATMVVVENMA
ncbi:MAG: hypothetical protein HKL95_05500 [Phycisphaerae bacterium]|nr:hypothetical protein [Phycisphaerae bacterium]